MDEPQLLTQETMKTCTISKLARMFGLSRSTLLYYDRIGLLAPSGRTEVGYRMYTEDDVQRLRRICNLRRTGLSLQDIGTALASPDHSIGALLEKRIREIGLEILELKSKREILSCMRNGMAAGESPTRVNKELWVEMLRAAGMTEKAMELWHAEFEHRAPESHHEFLLSLGISEEEVELIRKWSARLRNAHVTHGL